MPALKGSINNTVEVRCLTMCFLLILTHTKTIVYKKRKIFLPRAENYNGILVETLKKYFD